MKNSDCKQKHDAAWAVNCFTCQALNDRDRWRDLATKLYEEDHRAAAEYESAIMGDL